MRRRRLCGIGAVLLAMTGGAAQAQQAIVPPPPAVAAPPAPASSGPPLTQAPPPSTWVARPMADVAALDKIVARATPLGIRVGQSASFGSLTIFVRACLVRPPDAPADTAMFLDITDSHPGGPQFHGWMLVSEPSVAMLEHPVYDVRPTGCR